MKLVLFYPAIITVMLFKLGFSWAKPTILDWTKLYSFSVFTEKKLKMKKEEVMLLFSS